MLCPQKKLHLVSDPDSATWRNRKKYLEDRTSLFEKTEQGGRKLSDLLPEQRALLSERTRVSNMLREKDETRFGVMNNVRLCMEYNAIKDRGYEELVKLRPQHIVLVEPEEAIVREIELYAHHVSGGAGDLNKHCRVRVYIVSREGVGERSDGRTEDEHWEKLIDMKKTLAHTRENFGGQEMEMAKHVEGTFMAGGVEMPLR